MALHDWSYMHTPSVFKTQSNSIENVLFSVGMAENTVLYSKFGHLPDFKRILKCYDPRV